MLVKTNKSIRVAGAQISVSRNVNANVASILRAIEFAERNGADVLLTPEGSLSGYYHEFDAVEVSDALDLVVLATRNAGIALALGTCLEESDGYRYNQLRFYNNAGVLIGSHSKILLCKKVNEPNAQGEADFYRSAPLRTFELNGLIVGGLICNDAWATPDYTPQDDPHLIQRLAELGAQLIFVAINAGVGEGNSSDLYRAYHEANLRLRAIAARVWLITADAADINRELPSHGPSGVIDPLGRWRNRTPPAGEHMFCHTIEVAT